MVTQDSCGSDVPIVFIGYIIAAVCNPMRPANFTDKGRSFVLVLQTSYNMGATIFYLRSNLAAALNGMLTGPRAGWFTNFILVPFDGISVVV